MIIIDGAKCTGCGLCAADCQCSDIEVKDGKAVVSGKACLMCGHCMAICPNRAVSTDVYPDSDTEEYEESRFSVNPENLLNFIKFRRSIRNYLKKPVEREKVIQIAEAGRFTPTGGNRQPVSCIAVSDKIADLRDASLNALYRMAVRYEDGTGAIPSESAARYAAMWKEMYAANKDGRDMLFFHAPLLIAVTGDRTIASDPVVDCALAASNMELMAEALGLGVCYNGFFVFASDDEHVRRLLGLPDCMEVVAAMTVGYTDLKYRRTVMRKAMDIKWM